MTKTIALIGVAGSGKTTECLNLIKKFHNEYGYELDEIAFTTFTTAGIESMYEKLRKEGITLPTPNYFRTMHSLTWMLSGYYGLEATKEHLQNFFKKINVNYSKSESKEDMQLGNYYINFYNRYQNETKKDVTEANKSEIIKFLNELYKEDEHITGDDIRQMVLIHEEFKKWKEETGLKVYSDALLNVYKKRIDVPVKVLIIDEAQDLFPLQQAIIDMWYKEYEKDIVVLSGDDDQTVHEWAGASPDYLINFFQNADEKIMLEETKRVPAEITEIANRVLGDIKHRINKRIISTKDGGKVGIINVNNLNDVIKLINQEEKTFLLFRTNYFKKMFGDMMIKHTNIPFTYLGEKTKSMYTKKFCDLNNAIIKISKGEGITHDEFKALVKSIETIHLVRGTKSLIKKKEKMEELPTIISPSFFFKNYIKGWSFERILGEKEVKRFLIKRIKYYKRMKNKSEEDIIEKNEEVKEKLLRNNNLINYRVLKGDIIEFPVSLGTYHASKGLEADNVIIFLNTTLKSINIDDPELRALYTAMTRPKKKLYFVYFSEFSDKSEPNLYDYVKQKV